jgi:outer membrane lipoprotein carrier protein
MFRILISLAIVLPAAATAQAPASEVARIVDGISDRLAGTRDMSADFVQVSGSLNRTHRDEGHVYLTGSGKARWEYDHPETRLFVYDGNISLEYRPEDNMARIQRIGEDAYGRLPLMSVLGRRNLREEFQEFQLLTSAPQVEGASVLQAFPRRQSDIERIVIEADPQSFQVRRLFIEYVGGSSNDLIFDNVMTNTGLSDALFEFVPPAGTDIVDALN